MDFNDTILSAFPGATMTTGRFGFTLGDRESSDSSQSISNSAFLELYYRGEFTYCFETHFVYHRSSRYTLESIAYHLPPCEVIRGFASHNRTHYLLRGLDWWASVAISDSRVTADFGTFTASHAQDLARRFESGLHTVAPPAKITNFEVWSGDDFPSTRSFGDTPWSEVRRNYSTPTRQGLDELISMNRASITNNGRIIIFHGPPGTGKTWAIRSLLTSWKEWTTGAVIIDPDQLLEQSSYFLNMLNFSDEDRTRLVVIEDADEIAEKHGTRGSNLSRLLNATDGLVGASSNVLVLLSTNAPPELLDKALLRPGRCLASIEFSPFTPAEATARIGRPFERPATLAELYEELGAVTKVTSGGGQPAFGQYL